MRLHLWYVRQRQHILKYSRQRGICYHSDCRVVLALVQETLEKETEQRTTKWGRCTNLPSLRKALYLLHNPIDGALAFVVPVLIRREREPFSALRNDIVRRLPVMFLCYVSIRTTVLIYYTYNGILKPAVPQDL